MQQVAPSEPSCSLLGCFLRACLQPQEARRHWCLPTAHSKKTLVLVDSTYQGDIGACQQHIAGRCWCLATAHSKETLVLVDNTLQGDISTC